MCALPAARQLQFTISWTLLVDMHCHSSQDLTLLWEGLFGVPKIGSYKSDKENVDEDILKIGKGSHAIEIDLMQPLDPEKAPKVHIPALNHIGLWVDDLNAAVAHLTESGLKFTPGGIRKGASGFDVAFIHPKSAVGVLIELVQAPPDVIKDLSTSS
jgi:lactoylglutathione lyase